MFLSYSLYFAVAASHTVITLPRVQQSRLARLAAAGDRVAAGELVLASKGFILLRVRKLAGPSLLNDSALEEDLYAEGCRGMFEALLRYEPSRNLHPLTYCAHWIDLRIRNALALASGPASVGSPQHWRELGRPKTTPVALEVIEEHFASDGPSADVLLADAAELRERRGLLANALRYLDPTDRQIVTLRYLGGEGAKRPSLSEVGRAVGLSRERTRQREIEALKQLLQHLEVSPGRLVSVRRL